MRYKKVFFLTIAILFVAMAAKDASACSCAVGGPFLKVAPKSVLVIRARVLRHSDGGETSREMDVEVLESLAGETPKRELTVSGDDGGQCRPYVAGFRVGTEWILALEPAIKDAKLARDYYAMSEADKGDYAISNCEIYWLKVKEGKVIGNVDIDTDEWKYKSQEISLEEFRQRFKAAIKGSPSKDAPASNNGMHPTANSAALIRKTPCLMRCVRGG
jgi:hypothetical protein